MARAEISEQEWETFFGVADRLGIDVRGLRDEEVRFHVLESAGHAFGRAVARATTEWLTFARAERLSGPQICPICGKRCPLVHRVRQLETVDGPIELREPVCHCSACRRDFFPQRPVLGLDQRSYSPAVVDKIVSANAEHKSASKAQKMLEKLAEVVVSVPEIMDLSGVIGQELREHLEQQATAHAEQTLKPQYAEPPRLAAVSVDGGRIMTRADAGRGVHDQAWKETKNACLMTMSSSPSEHDPHPELPACFSDRSYVEQLVREMHSTASRLPQKGGEIPTISSGMEVALASACALSDAERAAGRWRKKWRPERLLRTCVSSMVVSDQFGPLVAGEAQRRGFYQAARRAFLGDGQAWNWTLQTTYFSNFVAITDFVHPLGYVYDAAKVLTPADPWPLYLRATTACWQGRVADFLDELRGWQVTHPTPPGEKLPDDDPRSVVQGTVTYLENNQARMDYPAYRRQGLPVSTSMIESLIKEINYRVKGTEKFWNRPEGAERILQIRAAALCDDDRLSQWILNRPGSYFYRPSTRKECSLATPA